MGSKEELGKVITDLDTKCPKALIKNSAEDEVEINVDKISPAAFKEITEYVNSCGVLGGNGAGGGTRKKKNSQESPALDNRGSCREGYGIPQAGSFSCFNGVDVCFP